MHALSVSGRIVATYAGLTRGGPSQVVLTGGACQLPGLRDLAGLANFGDVAKSAWITDDGSNVFCVPMASVIHGFIYNKDIFEELGITTLPKTLDELHALHRRRSTSCDGCRRRSFIGRVAARVADARRGLQQRRKTFRRAAKAALLLKAEVIASILHAIGPREAMALHAACIQRARKLQRALLARLVRIERERHAPHVRRRADGDRALRRLLRSA